MNFPVPVLNARLYSKVWQSLFLVYASRFYTELLLVIIALIPSLTDAVVRDSSC
jgi:hypothetical protein